MHPNWASHRYDQVVLIEKLECCLNHIVEQHASCTSFTFSCRTNWNKAVQMCSKAREFALALAILECAIKPVVMLPVWKDSLGHTR